MADEKKETRFHFDVVNSVKGGSGKSFFALQLAAYHTLKGRAAYIIDLDLRGTSWETNYGKYIIPPDPTKGTTIEAWKTGGHDYPYIDRLMWHYENYKSSGIWSKIKVQPFNNLVQENNRGSNHEVLLCFAETGNYRKVDLLEEDLFENTIFQIIRDIRIDEEKANRDVHIILDMPPSYEKHAERILSHLLLSTNSPFEDMDEAFRYSITLFMMSTTAPAHYRQNALYVRSLFMDRQFSSKIVKELKYGSLRIQPVVNDVTDTIKAFLEEEKTRIKDTISAQCQEIWENPMVGDAKLKEYVEPTEYIEHIPSLESIKEYYETLELRGYVFLYPSPDLVCKNLETRLG